MQCLGPMHAAPCYSLGSCHCHKREEIPASPLGRKLEDTMRRLLASPQLPAMNKPRDLHHSSVHQTQQSQSGHGGITDWDEFVALALLQPNQISNPIRKPPSPTWGDASSTLPSHAARSSSPLRRRARAKGWRTAACRSRLMTTSTRAAAYIAKSLRKLRSLQERSPPYHCTVTFHAASKGITATVTSRSASARLRISGRTWHFFLFLSRLPSTAVLLHAASKKKMAVTATRTFAACVNRGSTQCCGQ